MNEHSNTMFRHMQYQWCMDTPKFWYDMTLAGHVKNDEVIIGIAVCSKKDAYNKVEGRDYAEERLHHCPTFKFPCLHKSNYMAIKYYIDMLIEKIEDDDDGRPIKNHVARIQRKFDKTEKGVMLKQARQRKKAEKAQELADKKAAYLKLKAEKAKQYKK